MPSEAQPDTRAAIKLLGTITDDAQIRRSVRIEQFIYSISDNSISAHEILNPKAQVGDLHFGQEDVGVPVFNADREDETVQVAIQTPELSAPQVIDVVVGSTQWDTDVVNYLDSDPAAMPESDPSSVLPFTDVDQIKVTFNEDVMVGMNDLTVTGKDGAAYPVRDFRYEVDTATAVWTLANPIGSDAVSIRLSSVVDFSGVALDGDANGRAGGTFRSSYQVLPGDVDQDGRVDMADLAGAQWHASVLGDAAYSLAHDVNGDGRIDSSDFTAIMSRLGTTVPGYVAPVVGDSSGDGRFDSTDLVRVMQSGKYRSDQFASWDEGDWNRDGLFDESDLVHAFQGGRYQQNAVAALRAVDIAFDLSNRRRGRRG
jgi:hypothetical protein